jgi:hypothetical protein
MDPIASMFLGLTIIISFSLFGLWVWYRFVYKPKVPKTPSCDPNMKWNSTDPDSPYRCRYIREIGPDSNIPSLQGISPYLVDFKEVSGAGPPMYAKTWYRVRYVNSGTGGYGGLSDWTEEPIYSGSCNLPYPEGMTGTKGYDSCPFNLPTIGVLNDDLEWKPGDTQGGFEIYINVHRYSGDTPPENDDTNMVEGEEIIGMLTMTKSAADKKYISYIDSENPCLGRSSSSICQINQECSSQSDCT